MINTLISKYGIFALLVPAAFIVGMIAVCIEIPIHSEVTMLRMTDGSTVGFAPAKAHLPDSTTVHTSAHVEIKIIVEDRERIGNFQKFKTPSTLPGNDPVMKGTFVDRTVPLYTLLFKTR